MKGNRQKLRIIRYLIIAFFNSSKYLYVLNIHNSKHLKSSNAVLQKWIVCLGGENILLIKKHQFHNFQSMEANMARKTWLLKKLLEQLTPHKATFFSIKVINFNFHLKFKLVSLRWWDYKYSNNLFLQVHYYCKGWYHCFPLNWIITCISTAYGSGPHISSIYVCILCPQVYW